MVRSEVLAPGTAKIHAIRAGYGKQRFYWYRKNTCM